MSVTNSSPSQDSSHPDHHFQSRHVTPGFKAFSYNYYNVVNLDVDIIISISVSFLESFLLECGAQITLADLCNQEMGQNAFTANSIVACSVLLFRL